MELAPAYAYPHWYLGNLYLRNGRYNEAFAELRRAAEADPELLPQQFSLSWEVYKNDPEALKNCGWSEFGDEGQVCTLSAQPEAF